MRLKKKKKKYLLRKKKRSKQKPRKRRGLSLSAAAGSGTSGGNSTGTATSGETGNASSSDKGKATSAPSIAASGSKDQSSTSAASDDNKLSRKRKKKRNRKNRPRKKRGLSLASPDIGDTSSPDSDVSSVQESNESSASANGATTDVTTATTKEQAERWKLQDKLAEAKRKKIEKLKEKNPKLYKKIQQTITEQENKIKKFANGLKTKEDKAAFVAYTKNFLLNTWTQKFRDRSVKTGLRESKFNFDRILFQKLSPDQQTKLVNIIDETKAKSKAFQATLSPEEKADFEDMDTDTSPKLNRLSMIVEAGKSKKQKAAERKSQSDTDLLENTREQRKSLYRLQRRKNKGLLKANDVRVIDNLNKQISELQKEIKDRDL